MSNKEDCASLLNCKHLSGDLMDDLHTWTTCSACFKPDLARREDVLAWLTRVLLAFGFPALRTYRFNAREAAAPSLASFYKSLDRLLQLGYPKHWFADYLKVTSYTMSVVLRK
jgi:hypothetical protein